MKDGILLADANLHPPLALATLDVTAPVELAVTTLRSGFHFGSVASIAAH